MARKQKDLSKEYGQEAAMRKQVKVLLWQWQTGFIFSGISGGKLIASNAQTEQLRLIMH